MEMNATLISLFDYSGQWAEPFKVAGWNVVQVDIKRGQDILTWRGYQDITGPVGILAAPPCTDYSVSGAQYWKAKDMDGRTELSNSLVTATLRIVEWFKRSGTLQFWSMENPVGRLRRMLAGEFREGEPTNLYVPDSLRSKVLEPRFTFNPNEFAGYLADPSKEAYTKKTLLWGEFNLPEKKPVDPIFVTASNGDRYSPVHMRTGGKSEKTKTLRSLTPRGFAHAFWQANRHLQLRMF